MICRATSLSKPLTITGVSAMGLKSLRWLVVELFEKGTTVVDLRQGDGWLIL